MQIRVDYANLYYSGYRLLHESKNRIFKGFPLLAHVKESLWHPATLFFTENLKFQLFSTKKLGADNLSKTVKETGQKIKKVLVGRFLCNAP